MLHRSRYARGFTLIELLVVMVIIGIVASILTGFFISSLRKTQLRDGAVQILTDMRQARSQAIRTSQGSSVILNSTAQATPNKIYTTAWRTAGTASVATTTTRTLTDPIRVAPYSSANAMYYSGPYGEATNAAGASAITGVVWEISSTVIPDKLYVKTIGVTGKVILTASPN